MGVQGAREMLIYHSRNHSSYQTVAQNRMTSPVSTCVIEFKTTESETLRNGFIFLKKVYAHYRELFSQNILTFSTHVFCFAKTCKHFSTSSWKYPHGKNWEKFHNAFSQYLLTPWKIKLVNFLVTQLLIFDFFCEIFKINFALFSAKSLYIFP